MDTEFKLKFEETMDAILEKLAHDRARVECLEKLNEKLHGEIETLSKEISVRHQNLLSKDNEISTLVQRNTDLIAQRSELLQCIDKELHTQGLLIKTTYEVRATVEYYIEYLPEE